MWPVMHDLGLRGLHADALRPRLPAEQASRSSGGGPRNPAVFLAGGAVT